MEYSNSLITFFSNIFDKYKSKKSDFKTLLVIALLLGNFEIIKDFVYKPLYGIWGNLLRPRKNLKERYQDA